MIIERCHDQKKETLEEFYAGIPNENNPASHEQSRAMLDLISALKSHSDPRQVWGLTSHYRLCLLSENTYTSPRYVVVAALTHQYFLIEYRMPERIAPWAGAYVKGEGHSLEDAISMILIGMDLSEGWL